MGGLFFDFAGIREVVSVLQALPLCGATLINRKQNADASAAKPKAKTKDQNHACGVGK
ncbi:hypothetical protein PSAB6_30095 [Paraburkholderia sabiae]|nr:hypothetical protein PSAB6_30095 [Paraburkholderia sabiae]